MVGADGTVPVGLIEDFGVELSIRGANRSAVRFDDVAYFIERLVVPYPRDARLHARDRSVQPAHLRRVFRSQADAGWAGRLYNWLVTLMIRQLVKLPLKFEHLLFENLIVNGQLLFRQALHVALLPLNPLQFQAQQCVEVVVPIGCG